MRAGYCVIGTSRSTKRDEVRDGIRMIACDVTSDESVAAGSLEFLTCIKRQRPEIKRTIRVPALKCGRPYPGARLSGARDWAICFPLAMFTTSFANWFRSRGRLAILHYPVPSGPTQWLWISN